MPSISFVTGDNKISWHNTTTNTEKRSSIVCEVNRAVFFLYKYYKRLKRKIKTPKSIKQVLSTYDTLKKKIYKDN